MRPERPEPRRSPIQIREPLPDLEMCPYCLRADADKRQAALDESRTKYGQIPEAEYLKLRESITVPTYSTPTWRYVATTQGAANGEVTTSYDGACTTCARTFTFTTTHPLPDLE